MARLFDGIGPEAAYQAVEDQFLEKRSQSTTYASAVESREKSGLRVIRNCVKLHQIVNLRLFDKLLK